MSHLQNSRILGQNIKELLYLKRKNQSWIAKECNVTPSHISQIINGKTIPSLQVLQAIASALDVTTNDILNGNF